MIAYIDGFNLFYGLKYASREADRQHLRFGNEPARCIGRSLYWLDLEAVVRKKLMRSDHLVGIVYFSAIRRVPRIAKVPDPERYIESIKRQATFLDVLGTNPLIEQVLGWYSENNPHLCSRCQHSWPAFEEKVTDVNIASRMIVDAYEGRLDRAMLVSADADMCPAVEAVRRVGVEVLVAPPPGRKRAQHLQKVATEFSAMKLRSVRECRLPDIVRSADGIQLACPERWQLPGDWIWSSPRPTSE